MGFRGLNISPDDSTPPPVINPLPPGGAARAVLAKVSGADFDVDWAEGYLRTDGSNDMTDKLIIRKPSPPPANWNLQHLILWHAERNGVEASNAGEVAIVMLNQNYPANGGTVMGRIVLSRLNPQFEFKHVVNEAFLNIKAASFVCEGQNQGLILPDYAAVYKLNGGSITLRCPDGDAQPQIEDSSGLPASRRDIIDTRNGDVRYALKSEVPQFAPSYRADLNEILLNSSMQNIFNGNFSIPRGGNSRIKVTLRLQLYGAGGDFVFLVQNLSSIDKVCTNYAYNPGTTANVFDNRELVFFIDVTGTSPSVILQSIQATGTQLAFLGANGTITQIPQYFSEILIEDLGVR